MNTDKSTHYSPLLQLELISLLTTIFVTRISLYLIWNQPFFSQIKNDSWHHLYTGLIFILTIFFLPSSKLKTVFKGIALGLGFDEAITLLHWFDIHIDYWSTWHLGTTIILTCLYTFLRIFLLRHSVTSDS